MCQVVPVLCETSEGGVSGDGGRCGPTLVWAVAGLIRWGKEIIYVRLPRSPLSFDRALYAALIWPLAWHFTIGVKGHIPPHQNASNPVTFYARHPMSTDPQEVGNHSLCIVFLKKHNKRAGAAQGRRVRRSAAEALKAMGDVGAGERRGRVVDSFVGAAARSLLCVVFL
jgi:hypothetical protein